MKYGSVTLGQVEAVWNKLGGEEGVRRFLAGDVVIGPPRFKLWRTITIGNGPKTGGDYADVLEKAGFGDSNNRKWARELLTGPSFQVSPEVVELDLVIVTVEDLGLASGGKFKQIIERAKKLGLELCHPEVGPVLRLQISRTEQGRHVGPFLVGMEPITRKGGDWYVFAIARYFEAPSLASCDAQPGHSFAPNERFVFVRPRSPQAV